MIIRRCYAKWDDDQAIYGSRGSTPGIMKRFVSDFEGAVVYPLSANYRSSGNIVEAAKNVISYNCDRMEKDICSRNPIQGEVSILQFKNMEAQIAFIIEKLREESARTCFEDMAVLLRTNNLFGIYSDRFRDSGIPFK